MLISLNTIAATQSKPTQATNTAIAQFLDYAACRPISTIRYRANDIIFHSHSNTSYMSELNTYSYDGAIFPLNGRSPDSKPPTTPPSLNWPWHVEYKILRNVMASARAQISDLFHNIQLAVPLHVELVEMGHPQPQPLSKYIILLPWVFSPPSLNLNLPRQWAWNFAGSRIKCVKTNSFLLETMPRQYWWLLYQETCSITPCCNDTQIPTSITSPLHPSHQLTQPARLCY